jgi:hypothetical protein
MKQDEVLQQIVFESEGAQPKQCIEIRSMQEKYNHENQVENFCGDHQISYGSQVFEDHVATYMEDFINSQFQPLFHYEIGDQVYELLFYFQVFVLLKYIQNVQSVKQLLDWLNWKIVYT